MTEERAIEATLKDREVISFPSSVSGDGEKPLRGRKPKGSGEPPEEGDDGDIVELLNRNHALIMMGSKAIVMRETPEAPIEDRTRIWSVDSFKTYFANKGSPVWRSVRQADGSWRREQRFQKWAPMWLASPARRTFDGVEFHPDPQNAGGTPRYFNMWRGFDCAPDPSPPAERQLKYKTFLDHLMVNVCFGDCELFSWIFAWFAHIVQRPRERVGTGIVIRGKKGASKTKVGEVIGSLFPSHYFLVDDARYVTGTFNAHMASLFAAPDRRGLLGR
jgi:hypothetical protein